MLFEKTITASNKKQTITNNLITNSITVEDPDDVDIYLPYSILGVDDDEVIIKRGIRVYSKAIKHFKIKEREILQIIIDEYKKPIDEPMDKLESSKKETKKKTTRKTKKATKTEE